MSELYMKSQLKKEGRILIPHTLRTLLGWNENDDLEIILNFDKSVTIRKAAPEDEN